MRNNKLNVRNILTIYGIAIMIILNLTQMVYTSTIMSNSNNEQQRDEDNFQILSVPFGSFYHDFLVIRPSNNKKYIHNSISYEDISDKPFISQRSHPALTPLQASIASTMNFKQNNLYDETEENDINNNIKDNFDNNLNNEYVMESENPILSSETAMHFIKTRNSNKKRGLSLLARWKALGTLGRQRNPVKHGLPRAHIFQIEDPERFLNNDVTFKPNKFDNDIESNALDDDSLKGYTNNWINSNSLIRPAGQPLRWG